MRILWRFINYSVLVLHRTKMHINYSSIKHWFILLQDIDLKLSVWCTFIDAQNNVTSVEDATTEIKLIMLNEEISQTFTSTHIYMYPIILQSVSWIPWWWNLDFGITEYIFSGTFILQNNKCIVKYDVTLHC